MARYQVTLEREITEEGYITVEAISAEEAKKVAEEVTASEMSWDPVDTGKHWATHASYEDEGGSFPTRDSSG